VVVRSTPPGARVHIGTEDLGPTPGVVQRRLPQEIELTLPGFAPAREVLSTPGELTIPLAALRPPSEKRPRPAPAPAPPREKKARSLLD
jgi:hypothetical protein